MRIFPVNPSAKTGLGQLPIRVYVVALGLLGVLLASCFMFIQPRNRAMAAARAEIQARRTSLQLLEIEMAKLDAQRRRVEQLEKAISGFESRLPRQSEIDVILRQVWIIADDAGLKPLRIKTQKGRQQDAYKVQPIEMNLRGPFEGLYRFLLLLERLPGVMSVESLVITPPQGEEENSVEAKVVLNVFCKA